MPRIESFKETPRKLFDGKFAAMKKGLKSPMPEIMHSDVVCEITDFETPYVNAIRRVICSELPVKILVAERIDIVTDDVFVLPDFIAERIGNIPIKQSAEIGTTLTISIKADGPSAHHVMTGDFKGPKIMAPNMVLLTIRGGCYVKIKATVVLAMGYGTETMPYIGNVACQVVAIPCRDDLIMYDQYIPTAYDGDPIAADNVRGLRSAVSRETHYKLQFVSLGTLDAKEIFKAACKTLIERFKAISRQQIIVGSENLIIVDGESMTVAWPFVRAALHVDNTANIVPTASTVTRAVEIKFILGQEYTDPTKFVQDTVQYLVELYTDLLSQV